MLKTLYALLLTSLLLSAQATTLFGETVDKTAVTPVSQLLLQPANYLDKTVTISGTVDSVCSKQGCWMKFSTEGASLPFRIKVRDGDMVFPLSAKGKTAYATGTVRLWPQGEDEPDAYQLYPTAVEIAE
ncbi:DUF4920 domain-containing protein [Rheinheimera sp.]|uniref:DUF4920 domain-containing protein n=1 Tax=Rheinheimera sp. TaxID=1869214 RepID=UPI0037C7B347